MRPQPGARLAPERPLDLARPVYMSEDGPQDARSPGREPGGSYGHRLIPGATGPIGGPADEPLSGGVFQAGVYGSEVTVQSVWL